MFVEKLTKDELIQFITNNELKRNRENRNDEFPEFEDARQRELSRNFDFANISNYSVKNGKVSFKININKFVFTDFDYISPFMIRLKANIVDKDWIRFMSDKFGDEYKTAFLEYRKKQKEKYLKETAEKYDNQTKNYEREL